MKNPKLEEAFRHVVLLHSLRDAGPEVHKAIFDGNSDEEALHGHLSRYAQRMHDDMRNSAEGKSADGDADDKAMNTARRASKLFDEASKAAIPGSSEKSSADRTSAREKRVGELFKKR